MKSGYFSCLQTEMVYPVGKPITGIDLTLINFFDHSAEGIIIRTDFIRNQDNLMDAAGQNIQVAVLQ